MFVPIYKMIKKSNTHKPTQYCSMKILFQIETSKKDGFNKTKYMKQKQKDYFFQKIFSNKFWFMPFSEENLVPKFF